MPNKINNSQIMKITETKKPDSIYCFNQNPCSLSTAPHSYIAMRIIVVLFVIFCFVDVWAGKADQYYWKGYEADAANKYDEAIKYYKQAIIQKPDFSDAHYKLGIVYKEKGELDEALAQLKEVILLEPNHVEAHYNMGVCYDAKNSINDAISAYKNVISINGSHLEAHNKLAALYYQKQMIEEASHIYKKILVIDYESPEVHYRLASIHMKKGSYWVSIKHFSQASLLYLTHYYNSLLQYMKYTIGRYFDVGRWSRKLDTIREDVDLFLI